MFNGIYCQGANDTPNYICECFSIYTTFLMTIA